MTAPPLVTLKRRAEFLRVKGGPKWSGSAFLLDTRPADVAGAPPRFGFTVTKKLGNAVTRNRMRRRLKAAVQRVQADHARAGHDYVIVARPAALERSFDALCADLVAAFKRVHRTSPAPPGISS